jgi:hypothetical protein
VPVLDQAHPVHRALLRGAIDYAGLFPPAALPLTDVVANYLAYRASPDAWALGRLVVPAARLSELPGSLPAIGLSALAGGSLAEDLLAIEGFQTRQDRARVEVIELKAATPHDARLALDRLSPGVMPYVEVPAGAAGPVLDVIARRGVRAKVRTGGTTAEAFPEPDTLAGFILEAAARHVAFKATAGLHHALRGRRRLTYDAGAPTAPMFGYLNLCLAALVARDGGSHGDVRDALLEPDAAAFRLADAELGWRRWSWSAPELAEMRGSLFHGFGSCSFREPLQEWPL